MRTITLLPGKSHLECCGWGVSTPPPNRILCVRPFVSDTFIAYLTGSQSARQVNVSSSTKLTYERIWIIDWRIGDGRKPEYTIARRSGLSCMDTLRGWDADDHVHHQKLLGRARRHPKKLQGRCNHRPCSKNYFGSKITPRGLIPLPI